MELYTYDMLKADIRELEVEFDCLKTVNTGKTMLSRDIPALILGRGSKSVIYIGAQRGGGSLSAEILVRFAREYLSNYKKKRCVFHIDSGFLFNTRSIILIPMPNPDGNAIASSGPDREHPLYQKQCAVCKTGDFSHWSGNARGVDISANYLIPAACADGSIMGVHPESEPETAALCGFIRRASAQKKISLLLSLFCGDTQSILFPEHPGGAEEASLASILSQRASLEMGTLGPQHEALGLCEWFISEFSKPALAAEISKRAANSIYESLRPLLFTAPIL